MRETRESESLVEQLRRVTHGDVRFRTDIECLYIVGARDDGHFLRDAQGRKIVWAGSSEQPLGRSDAHRNAEGANLVARAEDELGIDISAEQVVIKTVAVPDDVDRSDAEAALLTELRADPTVNVLARDRVSKDNPPAAVNLVGDLAGQPWAQALEPGVYGLIARTELAGRAPGTMIWAGQSIDLARRLGRDHPRVARTSEDVEDGEPADTCLRGALKEITGEDLSAGEIRNSIECVAIGVEDEETARALEKVIWACEDLSGGDDRVNDIVAGEVASLDLATDDADVAQEAIKTLNEREKRVLRAMITADLSETLCEGA